MARTYGHHAHDIPDPQPPNAEEGRHRPMWGRATATTSTPPQAMPVQGRAATDPDAHFNTQPQRLDLKALRLAVHGWWLGNPLVYKPGVADLMAVSRELARAGAASGTCILSDVPAGSHRPTDDGAATKAGTVLDAEAVPHDAANADHTVHAILIVRPLMPMLSTTLGATAAQAVAEVAQTALGSPCAIRGRWRIGLRNRGRGASRLCRVSVVQEEDVALVDMLFSLGWLWQVARNDNGQVSAALFTRSDWREVFLARTLHVLDGRLRAVHVA